MSEVDGVKCDCSIDDPKRQTRVRGGMGVNSADAVGRSISEGARKEGEKGHVYVVGKYNKWSTSVALKEAVSLSSSLKFWTSSMHVAHAAPCSVSRLRINLAKCYGGT